MADVIPSDNSSWKNKKSSVIGSRHKIAQANCRDRFSSFMTARKTDNGKSRGSLKNTIGCSTMFQQSTKLITKKLAIPGFPQGTRTEIRICFAFAPSRLAASKSSFGTLR